MSKKFTEEQFNTLVRFQEDQYPDGLCFGAKDYLGSINSALVHVGDDLQRLIYKNNLYNEAIAIMNPVTRDLAYVNYVEKEKRYVWTSKKPYYEDFYKRLYMASNGLSKGVNGIGIAAYEKLNVSEDEYLTETEVRNNGYNPEMFDKEEVE